MTRIIDHSLLVRPSGLSFCIFVADRDAALMRVADVPGPESLQSDYGAYSDQRQEHDVCVQCRIMSWKERSPAFLEVLHWIRDSIMEAWSVRYRYIEQDGRFHGDGFIFSFADHIDAVAFHLRWSGVVIP